MIISLTSFLVGNLAVQFIQVHCPVLHYRLQGYGSHYTYHWKIRQFRRKSSWAYILQTVPYSKTCPPDDYTRSSYAAEIARDGGHYIVQGDSRSLILAPVESNMGWDGQAELTCAVGYIVYIPR